MTKRSTKSERELNAEIALRAMARFMDVPINRGRHASYSMKDHCIYMPDKKISNAERIATLAHEVAHATARPLGRKLTSIGTIMSWKGLRVSRSSESFLDYCWEEMIAEMFALRYCKIMDVAPRQAKRQEAYFKHYCAMYCAGGKSEPGEVAANVVRQVEAINNYLAGLFNEQKEETPESNRTACERQSAAGHTG